MNIFQRTMPNSHKDIKSFVTKSSLREQSLTSNIAKNATDEAFNLYQPKAIRNKSYATVLIKKSHWINKERRQAYMDAAIEQGIAWQIKLNRELRGMSQSQLAKVLGTKQSAISRMEDPTYGSHSLDTLQAIAHAFDCALLVKLISYSDLAVESQRLTEVHQYALPFTEEMEKFGA
ncbi:helix-turn-helix transcriptional regulator [Xanthomonas perforans]|uniref:helix-turn-helix domain-containing protein n=1 Tax=Xanthomonas phaseoli TaxID=1985254 RepID=UPI001ADACA1E|nr:helix-turn-helix transcriptional regulator [Xanthomonas phaseoli]MBO9790459.1 helix-turn-helix transcriptional regulator [Xanthomonas phaseoli pv. dieffenbachiae]MBO9847991.1 helix-turn-helix transcriptional regulator [Xanthomonas phaseoli pv. dieffenbachiae]